MVHFINYVNNKNSIIATRRDHPLRFYLYLLIFLAGLNASLHCQESLFDPEMQITQKIQQQLSQLPSTSPYDQNAIGSLAITQSIDKIGFQTDFSIINRGEFKAFFDPAFNILALSRMHKSYYQIKNKTYIIANAGSMPTLLIYIDKKCVRQIPLPAQPQMKSIAAFVASPDFGDNYGFNYETPNKFILISPDIIPIYYRELLSSNEPQVLLIHTDKDQLLDFRQPISEVIKLSQNRFLIYYRYEAEDTLFLSYFYIVDSNLKIINPLKEINEFLKLYPEGFNNFKYYPDRKKIFLSFMLRSPLPNSKNPNEKIFVVE